MIVNHCFFYYNFPCGVKIMDKKVIFFDIDGTLVYNHQDISEPVKNALRRLRDNGHYTFLCTGRNRLGVEQFMSQGLFDGAICSAGGYIEIDNKLIYEDAMNKEDIEKARSVFEGKGMLYNMESNFGCYQSENFIRIFIESFEDVENSEVDRMIEEWNVGLAIKPLSQYDQKPESIQTIVYVSENYDAVRYAKAQLENNFTFLIYSADGPVINGELMKKGVNKGFGILKVLEHYNLPITSTIGFGDSMNDLEMIETCNLGIVMANGDERLKQKADIICESVKEDGIFHELKRQGLL